MGLLSWLTGNKSEAKVQIDDHRIWLTQQAKIAGVRKEAAEAAADRAGPTAIFVVAHFNDCLGQLQAAVDGLDRDRVLAVCADNFVGQSAAALALDESSNIHIIVGERHPLPSRDRVVAEFAERLPCRSRIVCHVSLEDALIKRFAGDWVENVLRRMGMKEDEAIRSRMVAQRIERAMRKVAEVAKSNLPAESAQEWLERNC